MSSETESSTKTRKTTKGEAENETIEEKIARVALIVTEDVEIKIKTKGEEMNHLTTIRTLKRKVS